MRVLGFPWLISIVNQRNLCEYTDIPKCYGTTLEQGISCQTFLNWWRDLLLTSWCLRAKAGQWAQTKTHQWQTFCDSLYLAPMNQTHTQSYPFKKAHIRFQIASRVAFREHKNFASPQRNFLPAFSQNVSWKILHVCRKCARNVE